MTLELLRQLMERGGLYSLERPGEWKSLVGLSFVGAMLKPGGGRNDLPQRAKRHFHVVSATPPSASIINQIFGAMVKAQFHPDSGAPPDVQSAAERLVEMTVQIWETVKTKMLATTPAKFHYVFSLRDLARVFQGIFMCPVGDVLESEAVLISLWAHECERVFADRLTEPADRKLFSSTLHKMLEDRFGKTRADRVQDSPSYFADFMREPEEDPDTGEVFASERTYEPIADFESLKECVQYKMDAFNDAHGRHATELVLFNEALRHFMRISRVLRTPRGSALLVGVSGSGKQSLARLAAFVAGGDWIQPRLTKAYSVQTLLDDLRPFYRAAGVAAKGAVLLLSDKEVREESFLEVVNAFLSTGELPNLLGRDELDAIAHEVAAPYALEHPGAEPTRDQLWDFFVTRARNNLHVALCFSPVGPRFRRRAHKFPALLNCCTMDWFHAWPEEALTEVARSYMDGFSIQDEEADRVRSALILHMAKVHQLVRGTTDDFFRRHRRHVYVTPKSFLSFIESFTATYEAKAAAVELLGGSVQTGLYKLELAKADVENMGGELREKEVSLAIASEKTNQLLQDMTTAQAKAEKKKNEVQGINDVLAAEYAVIVEERRLVEQDLAMAQPSLDASAEALSAISPKDLVMLKTMKHPPEVIQRLFDCALVLFIKPLAEEPATQEGPDGLVLEPSYASALLLMSRSTFLDELAHFAKELINDETVELLFPYTGLPLSAERSLTPPSAASLTYEAAQRASGNVAGLCVWCNSMVLYTVIAKVVEPKLTTLALAEAREATSKKKLERAQGTLDVAQAELDEMQASFDKAMGEKQAVQADAETTQRKMDVATRLIDGLADEYTRWKRSSDELAEQLRRLAGDVAISCAFLCYAGAFNAEFRETLFRDRFMKDCTARNIPHSPGLSITGFLTDASTAGDWAQQGLPPDDLSLQNGIMTTQSAKWPLLIDPQGQGQGWIKARDAPNGLRVTSCSDSRFRSALESAMAFGQPLLLDKVGEEVDPILEPVLDRHIQKSGRGFKIALADKECEYSDSFRLYLACDIANPHLSPELFAQLTIINFTVTVAGLEQQLLGLVVSRERPKLERQRTKLEEECVADTKLLQGLEEALLARLVGSTGNLLDDHALIEALQTTKKTATEVGEKRDGAMAEEVKKYTILLLYRPQPQPQPPML